MIGKLTRGVFLAAGLGSMGLVAADVTIGGVQYVFSKNDNCPVPKTATMSSMLSTFMNFTSPQALETKYVSPEMAKSQYHRITVDMPKEIAECYSFQPIAAIAKLTR